MKRPSVWRSKLLKISAICSAGVALGGTARLTANSTRKVCSTLSRMSFCTLSMQHALHHFQGKLFGQGTADTAACSGLILDSTTETVWGYSFFR